VVVAAAVEILAPNSGGGEDGIFREDVEDDC